MALIRTIAVSLSLFCICVFSIHVLAQSSAATSAQTITSKSFNEDASYQARIALVIGNAEYKRYNAQIKDTPNAYNDAVDIAQRLRTLGFHVVEVKNATLNEMNNAIEQFGELLDEHKGNATALFYYAGHGFQINGVNYFVPVTANLNNISKLSEIKQKLVPMYSVMSLLTELENRLNIIILDACRNNPFERILTNTGNSQGWAKINAQKLVNAYQVENNLPKGLLVAYATAPGKLASDLSVNGNNGLFTSNLLKYISEDGLSISELFIKVRTAIQKESHGRQISFVDSVLVGEQPFCFALGPCEKGMSTTAKGTFISSVTLLFLVSAGFIYHRKKTAWVKGIDLKQMLFADEEMVEQLLKRSRFGSQKIVGYLKDVANKRILALINNEQNLIVGRDIACNVVIESDEISSNHLEIGFNNKTQTFWIKDLTSTNKTWWGKDKPLTPEQKTVIESGKLFYLAGQKHPLVIISKGKT